MIRSDHVHPNPESLKHFSLVQSLRSKLSQGLSQSSKDDIGVCVVIISITILAIIITVIKIVLFDISAYPELFGRSDTSNTTTQNT